MVNDDPFGIKGNNYKEVIKDHNIDYVLLGEGEFRFLNLVESPILAAGRFWPLILNTAKSVSGSVLTVSMEALKVLPSAKIAVILSAPSTT